MEMSSGGPAPTSRRQRPRGPPGGANLLTVGRSKVVFSHSRLSNDRNSQATQLFAGSFLVSLSLPLSAA
jgi:hypothetical protein